MIAAFAPILFEGDLHSLSACSVKVFCKKLVVRHVPDTVEDARQSRHPPRREHQPFALCDSLIGIFSSRLLSHMKVGGIPKAFGRLFRLVVPIHREERDDSSERLSNGLGSRHCKTGLLIMHWGVGQDGPTKSEACFYLNTAKTHLFLGRTPTVSTPFQNRFHTAPRESLYRRNIPTEGHWCY